MRKRTVVSHLMKSIVLEYGRAFFENVLGCTCAVCAVGRELVQGRLDAHREQVQVFYVIPRTSSHLASTISSTTIPMTRRHIHNLFGSR